MAATVSVNGRITGEAAAVISVFDHGFLYGEGIYETMRTYGRRPFLYDRHMRRLRRSGQLISLPVPVSDEELATRIRDTMARASLADAEAYIRVMVTRGVGELTYDLRATPTPTVVVIVKPHVELADDVYDRGVNVAIVDIVRNHPQSVNPMIKSNNLMNSALAMQQALQRGAFEGVMRNYRGELTECTTANLFVVRDNVVLTPPLEAGLLPGITRDFVFEIGHDTGIDVRDATLRDADLYTAHEAFLTSTTREIVPITHVDGRVVGTGVPGPVTRRLIGTFRARARAVSH